MDAGPAIETLAGQLTSLAVVAALTGLLAAPSLVAVSADTGPRDGVALGPVLALTPIAAVRSPVVALAACRHRKNQYQNIYPDIVTSLETNHKNNKTCLS